MLHNQTNVSPIEKIISILSYLTMGIIGLVWLVVAYFIKKKTRYFLLYNISQSMLISIIMAIISISLKIIFSICAIIPFINLITAKLNFLISVKILTLPIFNLSFNIIELILFILLSYIIWGVLSGRIFYIPLLTSVMSNLLKKYN